MKKILSLALCASLIVPSFAFANGKPERNNEINSRKPVAVIQQGVETNATNTTNRTNKSQKVAEMQKRDDRKNLKAQKQIELVTGRIDAAIARVQKLSDRVSQRLDVLEKTGYDVSASRAFIVEANATLNDARAKVAGIAPQTAIIATGTASSTDATVTAPAVTTPKEALNNVRALVKDIITTLQSAHRSVAEAISSIKPGQNKIAPTVAATSTPAATVDTTSTTTAVPAATDTTSTTATATNTTSTATTPADTTTTTTTSTSTTNTTSTTTVPSSTTN